MVFSSLSSCTSTGEINGVQSPPWSTIKLAICRYSSPRHQLMEGGRCRHIVEISINQLNSLVFWERTVIIDGIFSRFLAHLIGRCFHYYHLLLKHCSSAMTVSYRGLWVSPLKIFCTVPRGTPDKSAICAYVYPYSLFFSLIFSIFITDPPKHPLHCSNAVNIVVFIIP